ncbi:cryptic plasmid protein A [Paraburkholderia nodosa]|uniref:cryptic plasmid protein A n=1 Tax=Paraburkholderia nodosa TaxID=392320 RepID=UPI0012B68180|nr:cryptic plasmid protein A [Paraburkholderia nodosa]
MIENTENDETFDDYGTGVIIKNARDQRGLDFLIASVGIEKVNKSRVMLAGSRRPYVSNIAKALEIDIPGDVVITGREEARRKLGEIKRMLGRSFGKQ